MGKTGKLSGTGIALTQLSLRETGSVGLLKNYYFSPSPSIVPRERGTMTDRPSLLPRGMRGRGGLLKKFL